MGHKHTPLPWELENPCGFPYTGIYIVPKIRKDFPCHIAQIRQLREREESQANANLIITAVNVMPEVIAFLKQVKLVKAADFSEIAEDLLGKLEAIT